MGTIFVFMVCIVIGSAMAIDLGNGTELSFLEQDIDGSVLIKFGDNMNSPFMKILGHAFRNMERKIEKQVCNMCSDWSPWSRCSADKERTFGVRTMGRTCWYQQTDCDKSGSETMENETAVCEGVCPTGFNITGGGLCLKLYQDERNANSAEQSCEACGGHILNTDTEARWNEAVTIAASYSIDALWLAGHRSEQGGEWSFTNGQDPEKNGVSSKWLAGEPSNGATELCRVLDFEKGGYTWCDRSCTNFYNFICEIRF